MNVILKDEYIVDTALARLDKEARENFKRAFTGENPHSKVEVTYQFPGVKEKFDARIVIQMGKGSLAEESIGNVEDTFTYRELGKKREHALIEESDDGRLKIVLKEYIGDIIGIEEIEFSTTDAVDIEDNVISFSRAGNEDLIGIPLTIHYIAKEKIEPGKEEPRGVKVGYTVNEQVEITPISSNMDTARCLDALTKVVLIIMLETDTEKNEYHLQNHSFSEMQEIIPESQDRTMFGRPLTLIYTVSHSLDFDYLVNIKEFNIRK